ncbi:MAG: SDR family oxidoreductase [Thermoleophilaceae bacterium]|nr:SDR family oxidoreductase [Thermoleophilaceae bacterium]
MDLGLEGRTALVTGASRGIGLGIARALAAEGASVALSSRTRESIDAAAAEVGGRGYVHDTKDLDAAPRLVEQVEDDLGPIDVLVTNTGGPPPSPDSLDLTREQWEAAYRELVLSPLALITAAIGGMRERGFGRILGITSSSVVEPIPGLMLSTAHRGGLTAAFKQLSREVARDGVTVNSIQPGRIATDRLKQTYGSLEAAQEAAAGQVPSGRLGTVEEIGAAAAFLCSEPASYVTGVALLVDGGLTRSV